MGLEVRDFPSGTRRWTRFDLPLGEWILQSSAGHVDGTRLALEQAFVVVGDGVVDFDALAPALLDPKRVRAANAGVELRLIRDPR